MPRIHLTDSDLKNFSRRHPDATIIRTQRYPAEVIFEEGGKRWVWMVDTFAGERVASCFEVHDLTDSKGAWTGRNWDDWELIAQDQQEAKSKHGWCDFI